MAATLKKAIFFDAGDTLFEVQGGVGIQYSRIAKRHGMVVDAAILEQRFRKAFNLSPPMAFSGVMASEVTAHERKWWEAIVTAAFEEYVVSDTFFEEVYTFFEGLEAWTLFPEVIEVIEDLTAAGFYLGVISNFDSRLDAICEGLKIRRFFQSMTISAQEGWAKPSPEIFKRALDKSGFKPEQSIHIGDSLYHDVKGANLSGITPILVDRKGHHQDEKGLISVPHLKEIFGYLR